MDHWDSYCPQLRASEHAVKGTDLSRIAGKDDPVEFDFKQNLCSDKKILQKHKKRTNTTSKTTKSTPKCINNAPKSIKNTSKRPKHTPQPSESTGIQQNP